MDEKILAKTVREVVKEELNAFKQEVATKEDLKAFATKEDLEKLRAVMATKEDLKAFATKEDLKAFATKEDLKAFATKKDFDTFVGRIESRMEYFREGVELILKEYGRLISDIKLKFDLEFRSYDKVMSFLDDVAATVNRGEYEITLQREQTARELAGIKERIQKIEERMDKLSQREM